MQSPTKPASGGGYVHAFGHALARRLLGPARVDGWVRRAYRLQEEDAAANRTLGLRGRWRSPARFPWELPRSGGDADAGGGGEASAEALFVDVTFDLLLLPGEAAAEGAARRCHVLGWDDVWGDGSDDGAPGGRREEGGTAGECDSVAAAVAVRVGALVADPPERGAGGGGEGRRLVYFRAGRALAASDLDEHCHGIDIVREEMAPGDVARIVGDALLEGGRAEGGTPWRVVGKAGGGAADARVADAGGLTTIDSVGTGERRKEQLRWSLEVHHKALEATGYLPLSDGGAGESIGRSALDAMLLQPVSPDGGACVPVPNDEALAFWREVDPALVRALEKPPAEPSPKRMSPARRREASPKGGKDAAEKGGGPKAAARRPLQNALFARGKRTTLGGSRRKRPKFTLGPA